MESSDQSQKSMLSTVALIGFGLLFAAGLILWAGFGSYIFVDLASTIRSCF